MSAEQDRIKFLFVMYEQMWQNINRHIMVVWQSIAALIAAIALLTLVEKGVLNLDVATSLIILVGAWVIAHVNDSQKWYSRNLVILTNIERQFLRSQDSNEIHPYFALPHRPANDMIAHLRIQRTFALGICFIVLAHHVVVRLIPCCADHNKFQILMLLPYAVVIPAFFMLRCQRCKAVSTQATLINDAPGRVITPAK